MAPVDLNHLSATPVKDDVDFNNLPEQMGGFSEPPPPGPYRFELPTTLTGANFEEYESEGVKYLRVKFDQNAPLAIVQSLQNAHNGEPFQTRLSNQPRRRGKGDEAPKASDLDYVIAALGETVRPKGNRAWAQVLIAAGAAKKQLSADIEYSWRCDESKPIYVQAQDGSFVEGRNPETGEAIMGCGTKYFQRDVPKDPATNRVPYRIPCQCGASVRAFANLTRFRA